MHLAAADQIADRQTGMTGHHKRGIQRAIAQPFQRFAVRFDLIGDKLPGLPSHGRHQGLAGDLLTGAAVARIDLFPLDICQGGDAAIGGGQQGQRLLIEAKQTAQLIVGTLPAEGAGAVQGVVQYIGLHQRQLYVPLAQCLEVGHRATGALHGAAVSMEGIAGIEHPADGATGRVVDPIERARSDGQRLAAKGEQRRECTEGKQKVTQDP